MVTVQINFPCKITICNVYLPHFTWTRNDLEHLISQLPTPYLILGDFNAHNPLWGSNHRDPRGKIVEDIINDNDLVLLNTGENTYLNSRSNSFSAIDLAFCTPQISNQVAWSTLTDQLASDHFPISIKFAEATIPNNFNEKWQLERAD